MVPIAIAVVMPPGILRDVVVKTLRREPDTSVTVLSDLAALALRHDIDVVLLGPRAEEDTAVDVLWARRGIKVLSLEEDGRRASLFELRPHRTPLGELSPDLLLATLRSAVAPAAG